MTQIANIDWDNERFYLHEDTVTAGFDPWIAFDEVRQTVQINANNEQNYPLFIHREGKVSKGSGKYTPRYVNFNANWRGVPYDQVEHELVVHVEMTSDDELPLRDMFDRTGVFVNIDITPGYDQVEIIEVSSGSGLSTAEHDQLMALPTESSGLTTDEHTKLMGLPETVGLSTDERNQLMAIPLEAGLTVEEHDQLMGIPVNVGLEADERTHLLAIPTDPAGLTTEEHDKLMATPSAASIATEVWTAVQLKLGEIAAAVWGYTR